MKGGWRMEFINIQNKEGVTIINDTYDLNKKMRFSTPGR